MNLLRYLTNGLMEALSPNQLQTITRNFVDWLYADRSKADREEKADRLAPRLKEYISEGEIDPRWVLFQHLKRLLLTQSFFRSQDDSQLRI